MTRLLVPGDDIVQLIHNALFEVVQGKEDSSFFFGIRYTVCTQELEEIHIALFLVNLAEPVNH